MGEPVAYTSMTAAVQLKLCKGGPLGQLEAGPGSRPQDPPLEPGLGEGAARSLGATPRGGSRVLGQKSSGEAAAGAPETLGRRDNRPRFPPKPSCVAACPPPSASGPVQPAALGSSPASSFHWPGSRPASSSLAQPRPLPRTFSTLVRHAPLLQSSWAKLGPPFQLIGRTYP